MAEAGAPKFLWQHRERLGSTACPSLGGCTSWAWTIKPRSQRRGKAGTRAWRAAGHTDSQRAPRRPAALRSWLPPTSTAGFPRPLSHGFQQGLCPDPGSTLTNTWWPVKVYRLNNDKQWDDQGAGHVVQLCGVAEGTPAVLLGLAGITLSLQWSAKGFAGRVTQVGYSQRGQPLPIPSQAAPKNGATLKTQAFRAGVSDC